MDNITVGTIVRVTKGSFQGEWGIVTRPACLRADAYYVHLFPFLEDTETPGACFLLQDMEIMEPQEQYQKFVRDHQDIARRFRDYLSFRGTSLFNNNFGEVTLSDHWFDYTQLPHVKWRAR